MATLLWQRDIASDAAGVKNTFSSWDTCMSQAYCKWPAIIGIILGVLFCISIIWCLARCLCCGAECCCGCLACCNSCCPSPRSRHNNGGYQQPPAPPPQFQPQPYGQYVSPAPMYGGGGYRGAAPASTATFDAPTKYGGIAIAKADEDRLPAMPSWDQGTRRRVEDEEEEEDVEMEKLDHVQQQTLLPKNDSQYYGQQRQQDHAYGGDIGNMHASPYHGQQQQQYAPSPVSGYGEAPPYSGAASQYRSPVSTVYEPSVYPPSYHTAAPPSVHQGFGQQQRQIGRKPVQGTWRDV